LDYKVRIDYGYVFHKNSPHGWIANKVNKGYRVKLLPGVVGSSGLFVIPYRRILNEQDTTL